MEELLDKAIKVERQLRAAKYKGASTSSPYQKNAWNKGDVGLRKPSEAPLPQKSEAHPPKPPNRPTTTPWQNQQSTWESKYPPTQAPKTKDITCFKCHGKGHYARDCGNKRVLLVDEFGEYYSGSDREEEAEDVMVPIQAEGEKLKEEEEVEIREGVSETLVIKRVLNSHPEKKAKGEDTSQRTNLFRARCYVNGGACSMIIDGGSSVNIASSRLVENLGLPTIEHPSPYYLHWLQDRGQSPVTQQVIIKLSLGDYEDEILCDVAPMSVAHVLLGRPWQYDRASKHDGFTNEYVITHKGRSHLLQPLTPMQAIEAREMVIRDVEEAKMRGFLARAAEIQRMIEEEEEDPLTPRGYHEGK